MNVFKDNKELEDAAFNYKPFVIRQSGYKPFDWQDVFNILEYSLYNDPDTVKLMQPYGHITHKYWDGVKEIADIMSDIKEAFPNQYYSANIYSAMTSKTEGFGKHVDHIEVYFWQVIGRTQWTVYVTQTKPEVFILEPGDIIYVPASMPHDVKSLTPRVGLSISIENV